MDRTLPGFDFSHVQAGEIEKIIQAINPQKAQGYDCIPPQTCKTGRTSHFPRYVPSYKRID